MQTRLGNRTFCLKTQAQILTVMLTYACGLFGRDLPHTATNFCKQTSRPSTGNFSITREKYFGLFFTTGIYNFGLSIHGTLELNQKLCPLH